MTPESRPSSIVGNDVVDLGAPRASSMPGNARFLERVFSVEERDRMGSGPAREIEVWLSWAAKEAAYKVVSKLLGEPPIFVHRSFEVRWERSIERATHAGSGPRPSRPGTVHYDEITLPVDVTDSSEDGYVHALSWYAGGDDPVAAPESLRAAWTVERLDRPGAPWVGELEVLESRLTDPERDGVHSRPSAAVRIGARAEAARLLGLDSGRLEIVCRPGRTGRRPPMLLVDGAPASVDVSLSHDGPWIAWAFAPVDRIAPLSTSGIRKS